jgi:hypothetical protein
MREIRQAVIDIDRFLEDAVRAKQQLDAERWQQELRPRELRRFAVSTRKLRWSRALLKLVVEELYPDHLFTELVGDLDRVPGRRWPRVLAIAVALRRSWRREGIAQLARHLHISLAANCDSRSHRRESLSHRSRPSRIQFSGSPRPSQGFPLRSNPSRGCGLDRALGRASDRPLRDGRAVLTHNAERRNPDA